MRAEHGGAEPPRGCGRARKQGRESCQSAPAAPTPESPPCCLQQMTDGSHSPASQGLSVGGTDTRSAAWRRVQCTKFSEKNSGVTGVPLWSGILDGRFLVFFTCLVFSKVSTVVFNLKSEGKPIFRFESNAPCFGCRKGRRRQRTRGHGLAAGQVWRGRWDPRPRAAAAGAWLLEKRGSRLRENATFSSGHGDTQDLHLSVTSPRTVCLPL